MSNPFEVQSKYHLNLLEISRRLSSPWLEGVEAGLGERRCLLGVTGSGKTFTIANVIEALQRPTIVMAHNKTLAAQLYGEFKEFFPNNAVEYFVSYYDYYQPEAYVPSSDTFIDKDSSVNEHIEQMRYRQPRHCWRERTVLSLLRCRLFTAWVMQSLICR